METGTRKANLFITGMGLSLDVELTATLKQSSAPAKIIGVQCLATCWNPYFTPWCAEADFEEDLIVTVEKLSPQPAILLVEDNEDDVLLIRREFQRACLPNSLQVASSGPQAIAYLTGSGIFSDRVQYPFPTLVLLDINMPGSDGFAVLKWIRRQSLFAQLCVVVLSSSDAMGDVNLAHHLGADSFLVKPLECGSLTELWQAALLKRPT
jgi:CheY-like chemotaxis protein